MVLLFSLIGFSVLLGIKAENIFSQFLNENEGHYPEVPGRAWVDYPLYAAVPDTSFRCEKQPGPGIWADVETGCQVFYICQDWNSKGVGILCPNGTTFNQAVAVCDWWYNSKCGQQQFFQGFWGGNTPQEFVGNIPFNPQSFPNNQNAVGPQKGPFPGPSPFFNGDHPPYPNIPFNPQTLPNNQNVVGPQKGPFPEPPPFFNEIHPRYPNIPFNPQTHPNNQNVVKPQKGQFSGSFFNGDHPTSLPLPTSPPHKPLNNLPPSETPLHPYNYPYYKENNDPEYLYNPDFAQFGLRFPAQPPTYPTPSHIHPIFSSPPSPTGRPVASSPKIPEQGSYNYNNHGPVYLPPL